MCIFQARKEFTILSMTNQPLRLWNLLRYLPIKSIPLIIRKFKASIIPDIHQNQNFTFDGFLPFLVLAGMGSQLLAYYMAIWWNHPSYARGPNKGGSHSGLTHIHDPITKHWPSRIFRILVNTTNNLSLWWPIGWLLCLRSWMIYNYFTTGVI